MKNQSPTNANNITSKYYAPEAETEEQRAVMNALWNTLQDMNSYFCKEENKNDFFESVKKRAYPKLQLWIQQAIKKAAYYEQIAARYHFFKNDTNAKTKDINYVMARAWIQLSDENKKIISMLGHKDIVASSKLWRKLPQELIDTIREFFVDCTPLSQHRFNQIKNHYAPLEPALNNLRLHND